MDSTLELALRVAGAAPVDLFQSAIYHTDGGAMDAVEGLIVAMFDRALSVYPFRS